MKDDFGKRVCLVCLVIFAYEGGLWADDFGRNLLEEHFRWMETATYRQIYQGGFGENTLQQEILQRRNEDGTVVREQISFRTDKNRQGKSNNKKWRKAWGKLYTNNGVVEYEICRDGVRLGMRYPGGLPKEIIRDDDEVTATAYEHNGVPCWKIIQRRANGYFTERIVGKDPMCEYSSRMFSDGGRLMATNKTTSIDFSPEFSAEDFSVPEETKIIRVKNADEASRKHADLIVQCSLQGKTPVQPLSRRRKSLLSQFKEWLQGHYIGILVSVGVILMLAGGGVKLCQKISGNRKN